MSKIKVVVKCKNADEFTDILSFLENKTVITSQITINAIANKHHDVYLNTTASRLSIPNVIPFDEYMKSETKSIFADLNEYLAGIPEYALEHNPESLYTILKLTDEKEMMYILNEIDKHTTAGVRVLIRAYAYELMRKNNFANKELFEKYIDISKSIEPISETARTAINEKSINAVSYLLPHITRDIIDTCISYETAETPAEIKVMLSKRREELNPDPKLKL